ncbi:uncharacterized protein [Tiliqua scincoides]|uniref:uncharacterized protein n=1 Tax=Tiliqua scincoides TaxID=71010 RepID=UPI0034624749
MAERRLCHRGRILLCFVLLNAWEAASGQIHYLIPEELEKGSFVGDIAKDLDLPRKGLSSGDIQIISRGQKQYFALDLRNGYLFVSEVIDREQVCHQLEKCVLHFEMFVKDKMKFFTIKVEVTDVNDNSPSFPVEELEFKIAENTSPGARFLLPEAQDPDLGINSLQDYYLSSNKHFSLDVQTGVDGVKYAELVLERLLDREAEKMHRLILTAADNGEPVRSGTVRICVAVVDTNDNAPHFSKAVYELNIMENIPKGSPVLILNATDPDEGINAKVTYSFRKISEKASKIFHLDSTIGQISTIGNVDFEDVKLHEIEVQAQDEPGLSTRARVVIRIIDTNDNAPEITITPLVSKVAEGSPLGSVLALININDRDDGINGEVTCSIPANLPFLLKKSLDSYYSVEIDGVLDRETVSEYNITITASDQGSPSLSATAYFPLEILDENDNPPTFKTAAFTFYIEENNQRSDVIMVLKAHDPDCGENGRIMYSIFERNNSHLNSFLSSCLSINSETGAVYTLCSFDYEEIQKIQFQVKAQDGGSPPLSSNVSVTLFILDQNDNAPEILYPSPPTDGSTGVELAPRSSEPGYLVTKVVAVDADSGQNGWLSYQLIKATEPGLFTVGLHTGEIRTTRFFLEKDVLKQSLVVLVKDNGQPSLSASVTVTVVLADSIPEILSDLSSASAPAEPQSDLTFYLVVAVAFVSCLFFTFLLVLLAIRLQQWRNSQQLFDSGNVNFTGVPVSQFVGIDGVRAFLHSYCPEGSLTTCSQKSQIIFPIGSCADTLTPQQAPVKLGPLVTLEDSSIDKERQNTEQQDVHCSWRALSYLVLATVLQVVSGQIHYSIPEELQEGSFVGNITKDVGLDLKQLSSGGVRIITEGRTKYFALNVQNGYLSIHERVDREEICGGILTCTLKLEILAQEQLKIYTVEIEIEDINDNAPTFQVDAFQLKVPEHTATGSRFLLPDAQDPDLGLNSLQSYQLSSNRHFFLDVQMAAGGAKYAELVLEKSLDREEEAVHELILTASDGGDPVKSGTAHIKVIVEDANDNAPVFSQSVYKVTTMENVPVHSLLLKVSATDVDEGINSEITYAFRQISEKTSNVFHLDSKTGEVRVRNNLDFEERNLYEMEVQARDGRGLSGRANILLMVTDVNDNAPEITVTSITNAVSEDSPQGTVIGMLKVIDRDSGDNGVVICSILGNLPFYLEKTFDNYYSLVIDRALDREKISDYNVTIAVTDKGNPPLSTTTIIPLKILDKNDNPPTFKEKSYISSLAENAPAGVSIFTLKAKDPDSKENGKVTYSIIESELNNPQFSSYLSINSETGVVHALRSFDYEEFREIHFQVKAQDGGSPPLSSNVSVTLFILDQNDNVPEILYPSSPTDGSTGVELAPHSSEPGYLVTKVVAVDTDSGQNGWLSYQLIKATEPGLFTVGLHTGEIRTTRFFLEKDVLKQSLVVLVKDNGQPSLSASVTVTVVLADSISEILSDLSSISSPIDSQSDLTFYLVVAVAFVSCLFFTFLLVLLAIKLHKWRNSQTCDSGNVHFNGVPVSQFVGIDGVRAFLQSYCQEVSLTSGSRKSQILFPIGSCTNTLTPQQVPDHPDPLLIIDDSSNTIKEEAAGREENCNSAMLLNLEKNKEKGKKRFELNQKEALGSHPLY